MFGRHLITQWRRTQASVALSSGEAELNAMLKAACEGLSLKHLLCELGREMHLIIHGDSSASHGTLNRLDAGRVKHLETRQLWLQEKVYNRSVEVKKVDREHNWADALTHAWTKKEEYHFDAMGMLS